MNERLPDLSDHEHTDHGGAYPDEDLPEGSVVDGEALTESIHESFDFVVVGSGAAGAVAAHTLAEAGFSVAIVEEGPWVKTRAFGEDVSTAFTKMMRNGATQAIEGRSFVPLLQGRCVGGSTVVNSAIAWRTPEDVFDDWSARFGLGDTITTRDLESHFEALEKDLNVHAVDDSVLGENNRSFITETNKQGLAGHAMRRYEKGCKGSGR
ncbi:MAG: GMC family oxidoreductase N-terminal domain-containing protein, partial [Polyangiaceae bacterium]